MITSGGGTDAGGNKVLADVGLGSRTPDTEQPGKKRPENFCRVLTREVSLSTSADFVNWVPDVSPFGFWPIAFWASLNISSRGEVYARTIGSPLKAIHQAFREFHWAAFCQRTRRKARCPTCDVDDVGTRQKRSPPNGWFASVRSWPPFRGFLAPKEWPARS